ncbi:MAG: peptidyl-prolyl cis-trans isomerase, partial [Thermomonas sp.]
TNSDDAGSRDKGGDLGLMSKGSLPGPFEDTAFAMKSGEIGGPIKSDFGWHIIKVGEIRTGTQRPFEDVRAQLETELQESERERTFNELSGKLVDQVYKSPSSLEPAAQAMGLELKTTPAFSRAGGEGILANQKLLRAAFSDTLIQDGTASDPIEIGPNHNIMIRVIEHNPQRPRPLVEVSGAVVAAIRLDRQRKAAEAAADALVKAAKASSLATAADGAKLAMAEVNALERGSAIPSRPAVDAFFDAPRPLDKMIPVDKVEIGGRYIVYAIRAVRDGDPSKASPQEREQLRTQLAQMAGIEAQKAYVRATRAKYKIKVAEDRL